MAYLEAVTQIANQRRHSISDLADRVEAMADRLLCVEELLHQWIATFHRSQRSFRVNHWHQVDFVLPTASGTSVSFKGPYLSSCERKGRSVRRQRVVDHEAVERICGKEFIALRSEYSQLSIKLGSIAKLLDARSVRCPDSERKGEKRALFLSERNRRITQLSATVRGMSGALDELDTIADEAIFEFNAIEGKRKRYGSFLSRWDIPSRIPSYTLSGASGPGVFFISHNRSYRMTSPIKVLYERVHSGKPKGEVPLTRQMVQKSRLGKHYTKYREAYQEILSIRNQRNDLIKVLESIENYAR